MYIYCMNHYVDKRTICVVDIEIFRNQTSQPCGGWKTYHNGVHHLADPINRRGRWPQDLFFHVCFFQIMIVPTLRNFEFQLKDLSYIQIVPNYWDIQLKTQITQKHIPSRNLPRSFQRHHNESSHDSSMEARAPGEVQLYGGGLGFEVQMVVMVVFSWDFGRFEKKTSYQPAWRCMFLMWVE